MSLQGDEILATVQRARDELGEGVELMLGLCASLPLCVPLCVPLCPCVLSVCLSVSHPPPLSASLCRRDDEVER